MVHVSCNIYLYFVVYICDVVLCFWWTKLCFLKVLNIAWSKALQINKALIHLTLYLIFMYYLLFVTPDLQTMTASFTSFFSRGLKGRR